MFEKLLFFGTIASHSHQVGHDSVFHHSRANFPLLAVVTDTETALLFCLDKSVGFPWLREKSLKPKEFHKTTRMKLLSNEQTVVLKAKGSSRKAFARAKETKSWFSSRSVVMNLPSEGVTFALNLDGSVMEDVCTTPHTRTLSEEEIADCWWTADAADMARHDARQVIPGYIHNTDYQDSGFRLLADCCGRSDDAPLSLPVKHHMLGHLVVSSARGLEFETLRMLRHRQARAIRTVMETQERLRDQHTWTQRSHLLALQYRRVSAYSAVWARLLATGDELYREEEEEHSHSSPAVSSPRAA